jgi:anthranilate phosphoribosyltransferase
MTYQNKLAEPLDNEHPFAKYIRILGKGRTGSRALTREEAYDAMRMILNNEVEDIQLGAFLMLLRVKEESHEELTGFVLAVRDNIAAPTDIAVDLDWSSYAGKKRQLPWYLLTCWVLADQGIRVYMHGASGHTSERMYTEDVLTQMGIPLARSWQQVSAQLDASNFAYMPLENLSPVLKRLINLRNYLGLRSPVHTLSRLINPMAAPCSIQSIFHPAYADSHQQASISLQQPNAAVFKGEGGEIERKPEAVCLVKKIVNGMACEETWPRLLEGRQIQPEQLELDHLVAVWQGKRNDQYAEQAIIGTTAIALRLLNRVATQEQAMDLATQYWQDRNRSRL